MSTCCVCRMRSDQDVQHRSLQQRRRQGRGTGRRRNEFAVGGVSSFYGQVQAGDVRALAVVADQESKFLPGVPTVDSLGFETPDMTSRFTLSVPSSNPGRHRSGVGGSAEGNGRRSGDRAEAEGRADRTQVHLVRPTWPPCGRSGKPRPSRSSKACSPGADHQRLRGAPSPTV